MTRPIRPATPALSENASASPPRPSLVIIDDDPLIVETLRYLLGTEFAITTATTRRECIERLRAAPEPPRLALVDLGLPPCPHRPDEGLALIPELLAHAPQIRIVVLSGQNDEDSARRARALGAVEFVAKPADPGLLSRLLHRVLQSPAPQADPARVTGCDALIGESVPMRQLRIQLAQYADSPFPVLIEGESGTGKDIVARGCLHLTSARRDKPYFALNCAAISPTLVEPTLFGYAKGAFTGASAARPGYFEDAADGTLFLDEIGELPLELQPKLLRVLENGEYQRVGETQLRTARARVIAATNRDLRKEVRAGRFRADLYHRLSVFTVDVPALRDMGEDRFLLLDHYRRLFSHESGRAGFEFDPEASRIWAHYPFPGNVRELRNIVLRLLAAHSGERVGAEALRAELDFEDEPQIEAVGSSSAADLAELAQTQLRRASRFSLDQTLASWEQAYIDAALALTHGNVSQAARLLGIHRTTLYNRMEALARDGGMR